MSIGKQLTSVGAAWLLASLLQPGFSPLSCALAVAAEENQTSQGIEAADEGRPQSIDHSDEGLGGESVARLNKLGQAVTFDISFDDNLSAAAR
jgi:hypothetical protein